MHAWGFDWIKLEIKHNEKICKPTCDWYTRERVQPVRSYEILTLHWMWKDSDFLASALQLICYVTLTNLLPSLGLIWIQRGQISKVLSALAF